MMRVLRQIFPTACIEENFFHPDMIFETSKRKAQIDAFISSLAIAFEFQGEQHYGAHIYGHTSRSISNDAEKRSFCSKLGVTLIEVPFWWDKSKEQLESAIARVRPDIIQHVVKGKPFATSQEIKRSTLYIPQHDYELATSAWRPSCRGCGKSISPHKIRVIARANNVTNNRLFKMQMCLDLNCITLAQNRESKFVKLSPFKNEIFVPISFTCPLLSITETSRYTTKLPVTKS
jgi:hypothetical protein